MAIWPCSRFDDSRSQGVTTEIKGKYERYNNCHTVQPFNRLLSNSEKSLVSLFWLCFYPSSGPPKQWKTRWSNNDDTRLSITLLAHYLSQRLTHPDPYNFTESYLDLSNELPTLSAYFASLTPILRLALTRCLGQRLFFKTSHFTLSTVYLTELRLIFSILFFVLFFYQCRYLQLISHFFVSGWNKSIHPCQRSPIVVSFVPI